MEAADENVGFDRRSEPLVADDDAAALLKGLNAREDFLRDDVAIEHGQNLVVVEALFDDGLVVDDLGLQVRVLHDMEGVADPCVIPAVGSASGKHLGGEAFEEGDVALAIGDLF